MRIVFAGSPGVARDVLESLLAAQIPVVGVITQPDRPVGRKQVLTATPVSEAAGAHNIEQEKPADASELVDALHRLAPDLVIAVAYGRLLNRHHLEIPQYGWWNLHFSLLPAWRGATPVQHALLAGEKTTGVTIFRIDEGLDTGPILAQESVDIEPFITAGALLKRLGVVGAKLLDDTLEAFSTGALTPTAQRGEATLAPKLQRRDAQLIFTEPVAEVFRRWQAVTPEPGAYTPVEGRDGALRIIDARPSPDVVDLEPGEVNQRDSRIFVGCTRGALELRRLQPAGKREMPAVDWWRGAGQGVRLG